MAGDVATVALSDNWMFSQQQLFPGLSALSSLFLFPCFKSSFATLVQKISLNFHCFSPVAAHWAGNADKWLFGSNRQAPTVYSALLMVVIPAGKWSLDLKGTAPPKEKSCCQARSALWLGLPSWPCSLIRKIPCLTSPPDWNWSPKGVLGVGVFSHKDGVHPWPCTEWRYEAKQLSSCLLQGWRTYLGLILPRSNLVPCWRYLKPHPGAKFPGKDAGCFGATFLQSLLHANVPLILIQKQYPYLWMLGQTLPDF